MSLERSAVVILGGLAAFRPVSPIGKWVLCLLLLRDSETAVRDSSDVCICYVKLMGCLNSGSGESTGGGSLFDEEKV